MIRALGATEEFHACEELQRDAWNFAGDLDVVPLTQLVAAQKAGGIVLGGFDDGGGLLGFCYGFLGRFPDGRLLHYSHMLAVAEKARGAGLGERLKWAQRAAALDQGLDLMAWTYDPLESLNGHFNFRKLGVVAVSYLPDLYGRTSSALHRGMPTDRLLVEWRLRTPPVEARAAGESVSPTDCSTLPIALTARGDQPLSPATPVLDIDAPALVCEIPASIQRLKDRDPGAALDWRMATRSVLQGYLGRGYLVGDCVRSPADDKTHYVLSRDPED